MGKMQDRCVVPTAPLAVAGALLLLIHAALLQLLAAASVHVSGSALPLRAHNDLAARPVRLACAFCWCMYAMSKLAVATCGGDSLQPLLHVGALLGFCYDLCFEAHGPEALLPGRLSLALLLLAPLACSAGQRT